MSKIWRVLRPGQGQGERDGRQRPARAAELLAQTQAGIAQVEAARARLEAQRRELVEHLAALDRPAREEHGVPPVGAGITSCDRHEQIAGDLALLDRRLAELAAVEERLASGAAWLASDEPAVGRSPDPADVARPADTGGTPSPGAGAVGSARIPTPTAQPAPRTPPEAPPADKAPPGHDVPERGAVRALAGPWPKISAPAWLASPGSRPKFTGMLRGRRGMRPWLLLALLGLILLLPLGASRLRSAGRGFGTNPNLTVPSPTPAASAPTRVLAAIPVPTATEPQTPSPTPAAPTATPAPTRAPAVIPVPTATMPPTPSPARGTAGSTPQGTPPALAATRAGVLAVQTATRSGHLTATIDYGNGVRSTVRGDFDLGGDGKPRRIHFAFEYATTTGVQVSELIAIGDRTWERKGTGPWAPASSQDGVFEQLQTYLPRTPAAGDLAVATSGGTTQFRWYDADQDTDVTLVVDSATATPQEMQQSVRATRVRLVVAYSGWNTPVDIAPPPGTSADPAITGQLRDQSPVACRRPACVAGGPRSRTRAGPHLLPVGSAPPTAPPVVASPQSVVERTRGGR